MSLDNFIKTIKALISEEYDAGIANIHSDNLCALIFHPLIIRRFVQCPVRDAQRPANFCLKDVWRKEFYNIFHQGQLCPHIAEPAREWVKLYSPKAKQGCPLKLVAAATNYTLKNKKTPQKKNMLNSSHRLSLSIIMTKILFPITKNCFKKGFCLTKKTKKLGKLDIFRALFRVH